jgi:hypothetical protein
MPSTVPQKVTASASWVAIWVLEEFCLGVQQLSYLRLAFQNHRKEGPRGLESPIFNTAKRGREV